MKNKLKIFFLFVTIIVLFFVIENQIHRGRSDKILMMLGLLKKSYIPHGGGDFHRIFSQEGFDYDELNNKIIKDSLQKILNLNIVTEITNTKIPTITHNVYFFSLTNPNKLADYYIENLKTNFNRLSKVDNNWKHYIWTNMPEMFPEEIKNVKGVEVRLFNEFSDHKLYQPLLSTIDKGLTSYLAESADMMRLIAVEKYGGIYMDMDYEIFNPEILYESIKRFDLILARETDGNISYYGNAFFAASASHPVIKEAVEIDYRNIFKPVDIKIPDYIKYPRREYNRLYFNGPPVITIAYFRKNNIEGNNDVVMPPWMIFNVDFVRYKNKTCVLKDIKKEDLIGYNKNLFVTLHEFTNQIKDDNKVLFGKENIYYTNKYRLNYPIIGADMFCGTWFDSSDAMKKVNYYWRFSNQ